MAMPLTDTDKVELEGAYVAREKNMGYLWTSDTQDTQVEKSLHMGHLRHPGRDV